MERVKNCLVNALTATLFTRSFLAYNAEHTFASRCLCLGVERTLQSNRDAYSIVWLSIETTIFHVR